METLYIGGENHVLVATRQGDQIVVRQTVDVGPMPSFLAFAPGRRLVAIAIEGEDKLRSARIEANGELTPLASVSCPGGPAYAALDKSEEFVATASYGSGEVRTYRLAVDGRLSLVSTQRTGNNAHSAVFSPDNQQLYVANKGSDTLSILRFDPNSGELGAPSDAPAHPGSGPRHLAFSRNGAQLYVVGENDCTLGLWRVDETPCEIGSLTTLPRPFLAGDSGADIHGTRDGRHLYVTNRGHDSIAIFRIDGEEVHAVGSESTRGRVPRNFSLLGTNYLIVANQESRNLSLFARHPETGELTFLSSTPLLERPFWVGPERASDAS